MPPSFDQFQPPWWLRGPHGQTIISHFTKGHRPKHLSMERLELSDGDFLDIGKTPPTSGMLVFLFHGLEGSIQSSYMMGFAAQLEQEGHQAICLNFRSCGEINRLPRAYHSGDTEDIRYVIETIGNRYPDRKKAAVGFSLGGNALLMYLAEEADNCPLFAAAAISAPCDLEASCRHIHRPSSRFYERRFLKQLQQKIIKKSSILDAAGIPWRRALNAQTFWDFDEHVTAPLHGFEGASDYYFRSSSIRHLTEISCQTLLLQAKDDPMLGEACYPSPEQISSAMTVVHTEFGGHVGWVSGKPWKMNSWMLEQVFHFLEYHF